MNRRAIQSLVGSLVLSVSVAFVASSFWWGGVAFGVCLLADILADVWIDGKVAPGIWGSSEKR